MKKLLPLLFLLVNYYSFSQTKKIYHKSHSGKSTTLFMDSKNNFGPGMAPVRYRTPISPIKLNYVVTQSEEYPLVKLDTVNKTIRFIDINDSLLGCDRNYKEYISHGDIIYDIVTNDFYVFQRYFRDNSSSKYTKTEIFLPISDSIISWENKVNLIRPRKHFIRDGNNHRILMSYPNLDNTLTYSLRYIYPKINQDAQKILIDKNIEKTDKKILKKEERRIKKLEEKQPQIKTNKQEYITPISTNISNYKSNYLLRWITLIFLVFSLFIFVGVQRIVKDELRKIKH